MLFISGTLITEADKLIDSADEESVSLSGWLDPDETGYQSMFTERRLKNCITMIAPVGNVLSVDDSQKLLGKSSQIDRSVLIESLNSLHSIFDSVDSQNFADMVLFLYEEIEKKGKLKTVQKGIKISNFLLKFGIDIRKKLFKEIHDTLGGKVRLFVAGGAALDPEAEKGFNELGFAMYQGYGLTESSPVIAAEDDKYRRIGSIGKAFPSLDVKIVDANEEGIGELTAKGPSIMLGYYNNEEATKETIDEEGWLHTGDLARIDKDGYIFISGRKKFVIVLKNGKNIYPEEIEALLNKIEGVKESFVYGKPEEDGDYKICAKIVYDVDVVKEYYKVKNEEELKEAIWQEVKKANKSMPAYKYVREITITDKDLIKTTTQKIKRFEEIKTVL